MFGYDDLLIICIVGIAAGYLISLKHIQFLKTEIKRKDNILNEIKTDLQKILDQRKSSGVVTMINTLLTYFKQIEK